MGLGENWRRDTEKCQAVHEVYFYYGGPGNRHEKCESGAAEDLEEVR